jgi:hypothetical protein
METEEKKEKEELTTQNPQDTLTKDIKLPHLRPRLVRFCEDILTGNKTQVSAYKDCGFKAKNDNVAHVKASQLLRQDDIHRYITIRQEQIAAELRKNTNITKGWLLNEYQLIIDRCKSDEHKDNANFTRIYRETLDSIAEITGYSKPTVQNNFLTFEDHVRAMSTEGHAAVEESDPKNPNVFENVVVENFEKPQ